MWGILGLSLHVLRLPHVKDMRGRGEGTAQSIATLCNSSLQPDLNDQFLLLHFYTHTHTVLICIKKDLLKSLLEGFLFFFFIAFLVPCLLDTAIGV